MNNRKSIISPVAARGIAGFLIVSATAYLVLSGLAIVFFPGGTYVDHASPGYSWTMNFFSDLGRYHAYSGGPNTVSRLLFSISLFWVGAAFVVFMPAWKSLVQGNRFSRVMSAAGALGGIVAGIGYIVVSLTPWDLYFPIHVAAVRIAFIGVLVMSIGFSIAMFASTNCKKSAGSVLSVFSLIALAYLVLLFFGPSYTTPAGLHIQVVGQKIIVVTQVLAVMYEGIAMRALAGRGMIHG